MVSFGASGSKSKSKSKSESKTVFPGGFFDEAYGYFGGMPDYNPQFVGFNDFDKLEKNIYDSANARTTDAYRGALNLQNEDLSNMGMLNSPAKFIEGGARDTLNKNYISSLQQAARDASMQRFDLQQKEAGRETAFNINNENALMTRFLQLLALAGSAGRESTGSSSSGSFGFGTNMGFGS